MLSAAGRENKGCGGKRRLGATLTSHPSLVLGNSVHVLQTTHSFTPKSVHLPPCFSIREKTGYCSMFSPALKCRDLHVLVPLCAVVRIRMRPITMSPCR